MIRPVRTKTLPSLEAPSATRSGRRRVADAFVLMVKPEPKAQSYVWREYVNRDTGRRYDYHHFEANKPQRLPCDGTDAGCQNPNHLAEKLFVYTDAPKYVLAKGGYGGGKSVAGIVKVLERLRRGMSGIMVSPDFEHFRKSLWAEFRRWCPLDAVVPKDRYRLNPQWEPSKGFELHFVPEDPNQSEVTLYCGGMDDETGWEGPNVSFAHGDEVRRKENNKMQEVLASRVRIPGPRGEKPQLWFTTTPKKNWLYDWFGGVPDHLGRLDPGAVHFSESDPPDKHASFKRRAVCLSLFTEDNSAFLDPDYVEDLASAFDSDSARRVNLEAAWEDISDVSHYLDSHEQLRACIAQDLPPLGKNEPVVAAIDGAYAVKGDSFAVALAGPHPKRPHVTAIRKTRCWEAKGDQQRNFDDIEDDLKHMFIEHAVLEVWYDPRELHHMMTRLREPSKTRDGQRFPGIATYEFTQLVERERADKAQLDKIRARLWAYNGDPKVTEHFHNADKKSSDSGDGKKNNWRIVKRHRDQKIDLAVVCSMASDKADMLTPPPPPPTSESSGPFKGR